VITIEVSGGRGEGKTSILDTIESALKQKGCYPIVVIGDRDGRYLEAGHGRVKIKLVETTTTSEE
jgi:Ni2+-binding GTPase involved in maturation of urease and hydrogenase